MMKSIIVSAFFTVIASVSAVSVSGYEPMNVQEAWDNHVAAFGEQNVTKMLMDYNNESIVVTYEQTKDEKNTYHGIDEISSFFMELFHTLSNLSDVSIPVMDVNEEKKTVFLIWSNPASGIIDSTDTFVFNRENKISLQSMVFKTESDVYAPKSVQDAWDNHVLAFGNQDVEQILLDYDETSMITSYDQTTDEKNTYDGLEEIRLFYVDLFKTLSDVSDLSPSVIDVSEDMVFLVWRNLASGIVDGTGTFVYNSENKIYRQTSVLRTC